MGKTNIEYTDEVSNPLMARPIGDETVKIGTFCEKPDAEGTCRNCWAEVLNLRFGNRLAFDKSNRPKIEWVKREKEMSRLLMRNRQKPESKRNPGNPLMVFCCDTFDLFQPSITDELRDWVFDNYDGCTNLVLQIQTTYPAKMCHYLTTRYGENDLPPQYWIGISAGTQSWLNRHISYLRMIRARVRYIIFEPLLEKINIGEFSHFIPDGFTYVKGYDIHQVIIGGESGTNPRPCDLEWIRDIVRQCRSANVAVLVKQLGGNAYQSPERDGATGFFLSLLNIKGGDINEFPADLKIREFPKM
jgi:protein gp37